MYSYQSKVRLGAVTLNVSNLELEIQYYQKVLGLDIISQTSTDAILGVVSTQTELVRLKQVPANLSKTFGLYHIAILVPKRSDLGDFLNHLIQNKVPIIGGANHGYSEAIYLEDPEGNGIEVYHDNHETVWDKQGDQIIAITEELDVAGILADATGQSSDFHIPAQTKMGHIHLSVKSVAETSHFYQVLFGMTEKFAVPSGSWIASGDYHHHFAFNSWEGINLANHLDDTPGLFGFTVYVVTSDDLARIKVKADELGRLQSYTDHSLVIEDHSNNQILVELEA